MASQASAEATQQISQSYYDELISRRNEESQATQIPAHGERIETQLTLNEGEDGHIDIASSFVVRNAQERSEDIAPVEFALTQTQPHLTQFPESQRFKTPGPRSRKRRYDGQIVDSPILSRNPLTRNDQTAGNALGLSQAFAGTQAGSSPIVTGFPPNPLSDRPSPQLEQYERPKTATSSSPLLPIKEMIRATTEPAMRYVSVQQSQTRRVKLSKLSVSQGDCEEGEDESDHESSIIIKARKEKEREAWVRKQFEAASSPPYTPGHSLAIGHYQSSSKPEELDQQSVTSYPSAGSEEETEHEDDFDIAVRQSSQVKHAGFEDRENIANHVAKIPDTILRPPRDLEVQASPLLRYANANSSISAVDPLSSGPARVDDSQPSPSQAERLGMEQRRESLGIQQIDGSWRATDRRDFETAVCVEDITNHDLGLQEKNFKKADNAASVFEHQPKFISITRSRITELPSTVPESTTSSKQHKVGLSHSIETNFGLSGKPTCSAFATAQSNERQLMSEPSTRQNGYNNTEFSTPTGVRRKRMADITEVSSPQRSQTQSSFNPLEALALDSDPDIANQLLFLENESRLQDVDNISTRGLESLRPHRVVASADTSHRPRLTSGRQDLSNDTDAIQKSSADVSQEVVWPCRRRLQSCGPFRQRSKPTSANQRLSTWDIANTPQTGNERQIGQKQNLIQQSSKSVRISTETVQQRLRESKVKQPTHKSLQFTEEESPDPIALSMQRSHGVSSEKIVAPNMVFACFNGKSRAYYPALCLGPTTNEDARIFVQWEGYAPDEIEVKGVRSLDLQVGDLVKINMDGVPKIPCFVRGFADKTTNPCAGEITDVRGYKSIIVETKQRKSLPIDVSLEKVFSVPISAVYLDSNMWTQMKDRPYKYEAHATQLYTSEICTPTDRPSTPTTPSSRSRRPVASSDKLTTTAMVEGLFTNMIFAVSFDDSARKSSICKLLKNNGGTVLNNGFEYLFESGLRLKSTFVNFAFAALLTDKHSRKEKYMQALALGLPCLSGRWVEACIRKQRVVNWLDYLLPAGESAELGDATRSRNLPYIEPKYATLQKMLGARPKFFDECKVMFFTGRGKAELKRSPYFFFLEAMSAVSIVKINDLKTLLDPDITLKLRECSWLLVDDKDTDQAKSLVKDVLRKNIELKNGEQPHITCKVGNNEMIKQSLILGRLFEID